MLSNDERINPNHFKYQDIDVDDKIHQSVLDWSDHFIIDEFHYNHYNNINNNSLTSATISSYDFIDLLGSPNHRFPEPGTIQVAPPRTLPYDIVTPSNVGAEVINGHIRYYIRNATDTTTIPTYVRGW